MPEMPHRLPDFVNWPSFPFVGDLRIRPIEEAGVEPAGQGEGGGRCPACDAPDEAYIWVNERWRVRATATPPGVPMVLILESRSHLDLGDLSNLLAAELGVMTVRLERAVRSLDGVARVHVNRWGEDGSHLQVWFFARPQNRLQLCGPFVSLWNDILPPVDEPGWRENLALVAAWLAEFGGRALAEPPRINWQAPASLAAPLPGAEVHVSAAGAESGAEVRVSPAGAESGGEVAGDGSSPAALVPAQGHGEPSDALRPARTAEPPGAGAPGVELPRVAAPGVAASGAGASGVEVPRGRARRGGVAATAADEADEMVAGRPGA